MAKPKELSSLQELFFDAPLYARYSVKTKLPNGDNFRGYCPSCKTDSIFKLRIHNFRQQGFPINAGAQAFHNVTCRCVQDDAHDVTFIIRCFEDKVEKVGQFPTQADIELGNVAELRKVATGEDAAELVRAIGLAAHGVGIGAFVYLRRVFERVIRRRFGEVREARGWPENALEGKRMDECIEMMRDHLPDFLVKNRRLYGILSLHIHELTEDDCRDFFDVAIKSIKFILRDEQRKREEEAERRELQAAIASVKLG
ncbi:hypothetical protein GPL21_33160 [Bradyrhizobium pachyrhizi]|uniref:Uncharacterized protein n=1 Tax=Bradyrhizobium pachyrhizi TaxID=280333 RepID=A0A844T0R0_9BRAD|nr:hypothetical protein [Bradyrhizobium pachyrhizi]MVT69939.1 hypothetical protein [Bradyrhizobium pachyrhizi]